MASLRRVAARTIHSCRTIASSKTLNCPIAASSPLSGHRLDSSIYEHYIKTLASEGHRVRTIPENAGLYPISAILAGLLGVGLLDIAHADADETERRTPEPPDSSPSYTDLEETAKQERLRLEELLKSKGMKYGSYPRFVVAVKGQKITIKFQVPPTCEVARLISNLVSQLGVNVDSNGTGSNMTLRAWDR